MCYFTRFAIYRVYKAVPGFSFFFVVIFNVSHDLLNCYRFGGAKHGGVFVGSP